MRLSLVLCAVSAAGLAAASPAAATFTEPFPVSAPNTESPEVAVAPDGDTVFAWRHFDGTNWRVQARFWSAAGVLSPIRTLSAGGQDAENLQLAIDATGDAVMVWQRSDGANVRVEARARSAAGVLSPVQTLSAAGQNASDPGVDVDANGDAVFVWKLFDGGRASFRIQTRARSAAGVLSPVRTVAPVGDFPRVGVDDDGDAVFVWLDASGSNLRARTRGRSRTGTLSPVGTLSPGGQDAAEPQIAVAPGGDAVFAWARFDGANMRIEARARSASGVLSPLQRVSPADEDAFAPPALGVDATGDAVLAWQATGPQFRIQARGRAASGALSPVQLVSQPDTGGFFPRVSVAPGGAAMIGWGQDFANSFTAYAVARERTAGGSLLATQILSDVPRVSDIQVGLGGGAAAVDWSHSGGGETRIWTAIGP